MAVPHEREGLTGTVVQIVLNDAQSVADESCGANGIPWRISGQRDRRQRVFAWVRCDVLESKFGRIVFRSAIAVALSRQESASEPEPGFADQIRREKVSVADRQVMCVIRPNQTFSF